MFRRKDKGKGPCVCLVPISFTCLLLLGAELRRGHAQVLFHVFREEGDIREIEEEGDLLDALARETQLELDALERVLVDQRQGVLAAHLLDNPGQVFRGIVKPVGVIGDRAMPPVIGRRNLSERCA